MARRSRVPHARPPDPCPTPRMASAGLKRAYGTALGDHVSDTRLLAEPDAFLAAFLATHAAHAMSSFNAPAVFAIIVIVIDLPMLRRILG
jgi:hypothetical protein